MVGIRPVIRELPSSVKGGLWLKKTVSLVPWVLPATILFLLPSVVWTGGSATVMNLGGDDSHLMYAYPQQWLDHAAIPPLDQALVGYNPRTYFVPFTTVALLIHAVGLNAEAVIFGIALALTYLGVFRLMLELLVGRGALQIGPATVAATISVCAPLIAETQWASMLTSILWQPLLPWLLLLFIWHQRDGSLRSVLTAGLAVVAASVAVNQLPWTMACGLLLVGLATVAALAGVYRFNARRLAGFVLAVSALNAFWLLPTIVAPLLHQVQFAYALSSNGKTEAIRVIRAVAPLMSPADALELRSSTLLMEAFRHPELVPNRWSSERFHILGYLPVAIVVGGVLRAGFDSRSKEKRLVYGMGLLTLVFLYFETLGIVPSGQRLFEVFTTSVPGWVGVRNFNDKFATPFVIVYALAVGVCLNQLLRGATATVPLIASALIAGAMVIYDIPFLLGAEFAMPYFGDVQYNRVMAGLDPQYISMVSKLRMLPPGPVLTLPLSNPAWSVVPSSGRGVYIGVSPIFVLTGRSDYNGIQSFGTPLAPELQTIVTQDLATSNLEGFARIIGELGIRYVVVANSDDIDHSFYKTAAVSDPVLELTQTRLLANEVAPTEIATFGPYELRAISPKYLKPTFSLVSASAELIHSQAYLEAANLGVLSRSDQSECAQSGGIQLSESRVDRYVLRVPPTGEACDLILRTPYSPGWQAEVRVAGRPHKVDSRQAFGFANSFDLEPAPYWRTIEIRFGPSLISVIGSAVSVCSLLLLLAIQRTRRIRWALLGLRNHLKRARLG
jgi:hypothetical protein